MKIYLVGGAVRDKLLKLPVKDRDWVVVGASVEQMIEQGYKPVGRDFPVFLHPQTHEEYALARTERKTAKGYHGFEFNADPNVTLEQDLARRDLTINAMAETPEGDLIDPYHGKDDLEQGRLRHVSDAFAEDPVRILRVARFAARYHQWGFRVAHSTNRLMRQMVQSGEVDHLVAERVWAETAKAFAEKAPHRYFQVLFACDALAILFPALHHCFENCKQQTHLANDNQCPHAIALLQQCAEFVPAYENRLTLFFLSLVFKDHLSQDNINWFLSHWRCPNEVTLLSKSSLQNYTDLTTLDFNDAKTLVALFYRLDAFRNTKYVERIFYCCFLFNAVHDQTDPDVSRANQLSRNKTKHLMNALEFCHAISAKAVEDQRLTGKDLGEAIKQKRIDELHLKLSQHPYNGI